MHPGSVRRPDCWLCRCSARVNEYAQTTRRDADLAVERHVLLSSEYPALQSYARLVAKVIQTRDALREAFDVVLRRKLYPHRDDPRSYDPIQKLVVLVEQLRDNPAP